MAAACLLGVSLACAGARQAPENVEPPALVAPDAGIEAAASAEAATLAAPPAPAAPNGTESLPVESFLPALVSWPEAARWPQPVLVAAHGAGDHAERHCELWRRLLQRRGVVLCLRGRPLAMGSEARGYFFPDHHTLEREALAALEALARAYPAFADTEGIVYAGYSQGAQMGLLMLARAGTRAPRLLLIEGGAGDWSPRRVADYKQSGGQAVALVCGTRGCHKNAQRSHHRLQSAGIRVSTHYVAGAGHTYLGEVEPHLVEAFAGLTQDDARWADTAGAPVQATSGTRLR